MILLSLLAFAIYLSALSGQFVWDDDWLLANNDLIHASDGLYRMWFTTEPLYFWPVTNTTFWLEWRLWGANPPGYHVTNVALHLAAALLLWAILRNLSVPGAYLAALLWLVHPVNVQGVAWISQRKTVLSAVFFLLSILWYLKADPALAATNEPAKDRARGGQAWYWLSVLAFLLGMLSKASIAMLPLVVLTIAWWRRGQVTRRDLVRTAPFVLIAVPLVLVNMWFETHGSGEVFRSAGLTERLAGAGAVLWFYVWKAIAPFNLMFIYPQWRVDISEVRWWLPLVGAIAVTAALFWQRDTRFGRHLLCAWILYCTVLVPVLGFTDVSLMKYSLVADHYQYLSLMALVALVAAGWDAWQGHVEGKNRWIPILAAAAVVCALAARTFSECLAYSDAETLLQTTIKRNPECWLAHHGLGVRLQQAGKPAEAIERYRQALQFHPDYAEGLASLGAALLEVGRPHEAIEPLQRSLQLKPSNLGAFGYLAAALYQTGRTEEAIDQFTELVRRNPNDATAHRVIGNALVKMGRLQEALQCFDEALRLNPNDPVTHNSRGGALIQIGRANDAIAALRQAVRLNPEYAEAHSNLGVALLNDGQPAEAIAPCREALRWKPEFPEALCTLGKALCSTGQPQQALEPLERAVSLRPDYADAWANLGVAYAQLGRRSEAIDLVQKGLELARGQNRAALAQEIEAWLDAYRTSGSSTDSSSPAIPPSPPVAP